MFDVYKEAGFNKKKKIFMNGLNMGLPQYTWVEKTVHGVETHLLSGKEKVLDAAFSKEDNADSVLEHWGTHHYWSPWKNCNCKHCFLLSTTKAKFTLFIE